MFPLEGNRLVQGPVPEVFNLIIFYTQTPGLSGLVFKERPLICECKYLLFFFLIAYLLMQSLTMYSGYRNIKNLVGIFTP